MTQPPQHPLSTWSSARSYGRPPAPFAAALLGEPIWGGPDSFRVSFVTPHCQQGLIP